MIIRISGWILIFIQFLITEEWRELIIAAQTIFCAATIGKIHPYHIATGVLLAISSEAEKNTNLVQLILLHLVILAAVFLEYQQKVELKYVAWLSLVWTIKWLNCDYFYEQPFRSCFKCILFIIVSNLRQKYLDANFFKCLWILICHEILLLLAPAQLLWEIYRKTKKKETFIV
jgi:hypothetical protein|tara:strand:+ start:504 stop:1025 length:522 start_codon:yes stop_codon:yes gene_type:complete